jgi:ADP-ribose pyrophosphatase
LALKSVFKGRLIRVRVGKKLLPGGRKAYFEEVTHPGAAVIIPFASGKIVFLRQYRGVIGKYIWELPAGTISRPETPYACAKREVAEETGYVVRDLKKVGFIYTSPGFCNEKIYIFKAECAAKKAPNMSEGELLRVKLFTRKEVVKLFEDGRINDSKTIAALAYTHII